MLRDRRADEQSHQDQKLKQANQREGHAGRVREAGVLFQIAAQAREEDGQEDRGKKDEENLRRVPEENRSGNNGGDAESDLKAPAHRGIGASRTLRFGWRFRPVVS